MRCQNCNKFTSLNFEEPEVQDSQIDEEGHVQIDVRIYRTTDCCGDEAKEATLNMEMDMPEDILHDHEGEGHEFSIECDDPEQVEEGGGRYAKSYFGASVHFSVTCSCKKEPIWESDVEDKIAASHMDELL